MPGFKSTLSGNSLIGKLFTSVVLHQAAKLVAALLRVARVTVGVAESNGSLRRVYDSRHLQADCQKPGSAPEPYAEQSSTVYLYPFTVIQHAIMQHDLFKNIPGFTEEFTYSTCRNQKYKNTQK